MEEYIRLSEEYTRRKEQVVKEDFRSATAQSQRSIDRGTKRKQLGKIKRRQEKANNQTNIQTGKQTSN